MKGTICTGLLFGAVAAVCLFARTSARSPRPLRRAVAQAVADWPQFRGPGGLGRSDAEGLPVSWSSDENLVWKTELPGAGTSSPIVVGNHLYLTCYTGYAVPEQPRGDINELVRHLLCLNRSDGKILWTKDVPASQPEQPRVRDHGYAASTPVADAERVYVFFGKSGVLAFDHGGRQLWQADVGSRIHGWGSGASPVLYKDLVIINASVESQSLVALDKRTGGEVWRAPGIRESWNTPALVGVPGGHPSRLTPQPNRRRRDRQA